MGISDDIRPKTYRPISKKAVKSEIKAAKKKIDENDDGQLFQQTHDGDFFDNTPIENNHRDKTNNSSVVHSSDQHSYRWLYILITILAVLTLIGVVIWQNFDLVKSYFNGSYKEKNSQSLSDIISSTNDSLKNYDSNQNKTATQTTDTSLQTNPSVTTVDKSTIIISVLNGSGIKNSASSVADTLKQAGFNVKSTANAKSFTYVKTYIYYKEGNLEKANLVKDALPDRQCEVSLSNTVVGATYDIVVVVGKT